jgi:hypothetical protein
MSADKSYEQGMEVRRTILRFAAGSRLSILLALAVAAPLVVLNAEDSRSQSRSSSGSIHVLVPAAIIGDNYWIYLNGQIVNAPPHSNAVNPKASGLTSVTTPWGRKIYNDHGLVLEMGNEDCGCVAGTTCYSSVLQYPQPIFQEVILPNFPPGTYTLDAFYVNDNPTVPFRVTHFPFVITRSHTFALTAGGEVHRCLAIPKEWSNWALPASAAPPCENAPVDEQIVKGWAERYAHDPIVVALNAVSIAIRSPSAHTVMLNLPAEHGGRREFDGKQIALMVDGILQYHSIPSEDKGPNDCERLYPQYAGSWYQYHQILATMIKNINDFRRLSAELGQK